MTDLAPARAHNEGEEPTIHELAEKIALLFQDSMAMRTKLTLRVARRVTLLLRASMFSFAVVGLLLSGILFTLTSQVGKLIETVVTMNHHFTQMTNDMKVMQQVVHEMSVKVHAMPEITDEVARMEHTVARMSGNIDAVGSLVDNITRNMSSITGNVNSMTHTLGAMDREVSGIGNGVNRMSRPMKMFNSMMPLP